jgi:transposase InsO family protein
MNEIGLIVAIRVLTGWGSQRIARNLKSQSQGQVEVSHTTVWRIICRHHLPRRINHPQGKKDGIAYRRYQRDTRNSLWHVDYKTSPLLILGTEVSILVVIDDATRYCLAAEAHLGWANTDWAVEVLNSCFQRYGRPKQLLTDNDRIFVGGANRPPADGTPPRCRFRQAIAPTPLLTTSPYYPQCNGKAEALIRTLMVECLWLERADRGEEGFVSVDEIQAVLDEFVQYYNLHREHSALAYQPPASRYLGTRYASLGFAAVPRLKHLPLPFPKLDESPEELSAYEIQRCFAVVKVQ